MTKCSTERDVHASGVGAARDTVSVSSWELCAQSGASAVGARTASKSRDHLLISWQLPTRSKF